MPALASVTRGNYVAQQQLSNATERRALALWGHVHPSYIASSFREIAPQLLTVVTTAQAAAAIPADRYVESALEAQGNYDLPTFDVVPEAFAGYASDGRLLSSLLAEPTIAAKTLIGGGMEPASALAAAGQRLGRIIATQIADANRGATQSSLLAYRGIGWVRQLNPPSCSRCMILAGKWYRWNEGFQRHPRCDCRHVPADKAAGEKLKTDPYAAFRALSEPEQDKAFGRSNARAIREGADIYRVVNVQSRGLSSPASRQAQRFGTPTRVTPDQIFRTAGTRANAIRMLTQHGYITGPQTAGGNILGRYREGFGQLGKGGVARAASNAVQAARESGNRDPLNRYTMTAQERALYDAVKRVEAVNRGINPYVASGTVQRPLTRIQADTARRDLANQLAKLTADPRTGRAAAPGSVQKLARLLGVA